MLCYILSSHSDDATRTGRGLMSSSNPEPVLVIIELGEAPPSEPPSVEEAIDQLTAALMACAECAMLTGDPLYAEIMETVGKVILVVGAAEAAIWNGTAENPITLSNNLADAASRFATELQATVVVSLELGIPSAEALRAVMEGGSPTRLDLALAACLPDAARQSSTEGSDDEDESAGEVTTASRG